MELPRGADVLIVGAGIVGCACADALSADGARVVVLESALTGGGATAAAMGHLVVMDDSPAQMALTALSTSLWNSHADELSSVAEYERRGTLWLAASEDEMDIASSRQRAYQALGLASELLDPGALREAEPALGPELAGALLVPGDAVLYPPNAARWFLGRARARGAIVLEPCAVQSIAGGRVEARVEGQSITIQAPAIINAAGIDAPNLTAGLPIVPRKGHLAITDRYPALCRHQLVEFGYVAKAHGLGEASTAFNVQPRATGQLLIGSSRQLVGRDGSLDSAVMASMLGQAVQWLPALASCRIIRAWTGFRPATPDSLPLIGPWPREPGLWIAAGHEGLGITTAPATAAIISALIGGRTPPIDPQPFAPARVSVGAEVA